MGVNQNCLRDENNFSRTRPKFNDNRSQCIMNRAMIYIKSLSLIFGTSNRLSFEDRYVEKVMYDLSNNIFRECGADLRYNEKMQSTGNRVISKCDADLRSIAKIQRTSQNAGSLSFDIKGEQGERNQSHFLKTRPFLSTLSFSYQQR